MNRRMLISSAPIVALAGLVPVAPVRAACALPIAESPLRALYREWQLAKDAYRDLPDDCDEEADDAAYWRMVSFEDAAMSHVPQTVEDMAIMIIFADDNGDMNQPQMALAKLAYQITGIIPRHQIGGVL